MPDPKVLDNTPYWLEDSRKSSGQGLGRCNPYGYEKDPSVMGGTADIANEQFLYYCQNQADARYHVICDRGHRGHLVLCYPHAYNFRKRQASVCPRCVWPAEARQLDKDMNDTMREIASLAPWDSARVRALAKLDDLRAAMDDLIRRDVVHRGELRLEEVS